MAQPPEGTLPPLPVHRGLLQMPTDLRGLTQVLDWFGQFNQPPLNYQAWWQCQLSLDEGFTNAVRHAHAALPPETLIEIVVKIYPTWMEMEIWDQGPWFDLENHLTNLGEGPADPEQEGGRGLLLIRTFMDHVRYVRAEDTRNCLVMQKCFAGDGGQQ
ncbi:MAG: ATP-binding protein [Gloeomargaritaceae cyanobacterium C42_A2020_066]|nr:ATP-binding protein [Gloeomargaritaceae cyanobacterium C42_A2020_066]